MQLLAERGEEVRCLLRAGTQVDSVRREGVEVVRGDLTDHASLPAACRGIDTVVATATVIGRRLAGGQNQPSILDVDETGMAALVEAADSEGVQRFVYVSLAGINKSRPGPLERVRLGTERRLVGCSRMQPVIVRPDAFQEIHIGPVGRFDLHAGKWRCSAKGDAKRRWVGVEDVAQLLAALTVEPDPPAVIDFGGPEALSRHEAIAVAERFTGRSIRRQRMPQALAQLGSRLLDERNDALASIFSLGVQRDNVDAEWNDAPLRSRGITPRSATEWLEQQASALAWDRTSRQSYSPDNDPGSVRSTRAVTSSPSRTCPTPQRAITIYPRVARLHKITHGPYRKMRRPPESSRRPALLASR